MPSFYKKTHTSEKIFYFHEVSEKIWLSPGSIIIKLDSLRCLVFFTDTVWIVGPLGQAIHLIIFVISSHIQYSSLLILRLLTYLTFYYVKIMNYKYLLFNPICSLARNTLIIVNSFFQFFEIYIVKPFQLKLHDFQIHRNKLVSGFSHWYNVHTENWIQRLNFLKTYCSCHSCSCTLLSS